MKNKPYKCCKTATSVDTNVTVAIIKGGVNHLEVKTSIHLYKNADKLVHGVAPCQVTVVRVRFLTKHTNKHR